MNSNPSENIQEQSVISTAAFLKQVDLRCEDHLSKAHTDVQATRYCSECKVLCCDSCVIEYHHKHIESAKTKIDDYFRNQKRDLEDLKLKINNSIKLKVNNEEIETLIEDNAKIVNAFFSRRKNVLNEMKSKIDNLSKEEESLESLFINTIQSFFKEECYAKLNRVLSQNEELLKKVEKFFKDFDSYSKSEKVVALKDDQVKQFKLESDDNCEKIKNESFNFKVKSKILENKIGIILNKLNYSQEFFQFETVVNNMINTILESKKSINMLKYDQLVEDSQENKNCFTFAKNKELQINSNLNNNNNINSALVEFNLNNNKILNGVNNAASNDISNMSDILHNLSNVQNKEKLLNENSSNPLSTNYDYFISIKPKSDEIIIFSVKYGFTTTHVNVSQFYNQDVFHLSSFPENSKYINLGSSLLITGGYSNKILTNYCSLVIVSRNETTKEFEAISVNYGKMKEGRERHNIVYLEDRKSVLVCSGFFNKGCEITNLEEGEWRQLSQMNEVRANATIAYINRRYVYVIGGYKSPDSRMGPGVYLGDCEYFDLNDELRGWTSIKFGDNNLRLTAMGVVPYDSKSFIICGGYDGNQYKKDVYKVVVENKDNPDIERLLVPLPDCFIFLHNTFLKNGNVAVNLDLRNNAVIMSLSNFRTQVQNFNPNNSI